MHFLFYQHNVQQFFIRHAEKFDGIIVPLSIAASFPSGTYGFLRALLAKHRTKQFAIDPRSALFQHNWNRGNVREPHRKMAAIFGEPFVSIGLNRPLTVGDLSAEITKSVTDACLRYQLGFRVLQEEQRKLEKYRKLLGIDAIPEIQNPQRLVPPYFQFSEIGNPWCEINIRCAEYATAMVPPNQLSPILHFSSWSPADDWRQIAKRLSASGIRSLFLYPNYFKEHEASEIDLQKYSDTVSAISAESVDAQTLHGGYFAVLLQKKGLSGFGNGVGYGEWRDSGYHRGGTAEVRIYVPKLHRFLDPANAQALLERSAEYFTSDSDLLSEYALAKNPLTRVQPQEALDHFMECRQYEIDFVRTNSLQTLTAELNDTLAVLRGIGVLELEQYGKSLHKWSNVLSR
jgi:hypothetical protein